MEEEDDNDKDTDGSDTSLRKNIRILLISSFVLFYLGQISIYISKFLILLIKFLTNNCINLNPDFHIMY